MKREKNNNKASELKSFQLSTRSRIDSPTDQAGQGTQYEIQLKVLEH
jgi:hypothetical protein